jgi:hypothetical protein
VLDLLAFSAISDHYFLSNQALSAFESFASPNSQRLKYCAQHYQSKIRDTYYEILLKAGLTFMTL